MNEHLKGQARARYGITITDADIASATAQCRSGRHLIRSCERDSNGASEHHAVLVRGKKKMCAVVKDGRLATFLPPDWLPHDTETVMAFAFRRAGVRS
jgi:hypothetical protein